MRARRVPTSSAPGSGSRRRSTRSGSRARASRQRRSSASSKSSTARNPDNEKRRPVGTRRRSWRRWIVRRRCSSASSTHYWYLEQKGQRQHQHRHRRTLPQHPVTGSLSWKGSWSLCDGWLNHSILYKTVQSHKSDLLLIGQRDRAAVVVMHRGLPSVLPFGRLQDPKPSYSVSEQQMMAGRRDSYASRPAGHWGDQTVPPQAPAGATKFPATD